MYTSCMSEFRKGETTMNENAKLLIYEIKKGLEISPLVKVDIQEYADYLDVSLRSAQRYIADIAAIGTA